MPLGIQITKIRFGEIKSEDVGLRVINPRSIGNKSKLEIHCYLTNGKVNYDDPNGEMPQVTQLTSFDPFMELSIDPLHAEIFESRREIMGMRSRRNRCHLEKSMPSEDGHYLVRFSVDFDDFEEIPNGLHVNYAIKHSVDTAICDIREFNRSKFVEFV